MQGRIREMIVKEFIQVFRDRRMIAIIFIVPVMQLLVFGYAVTTDVSEIPTVVHDLDRSSESREVVQRLEASGYFRIVAYPVSDAEVQELLDRGRAAAALRIDRGFGTDLKAQRPAQIQVLVDGTDSNTATIVLDYANRIILRYAKEQGQLVSPSVLDLRTRAWYNPDLRSRNYNVPGVIAFVIMLTCLLLTSMAIVREREIGTMEQLMVSPLRPLELILGKTIPFALIGFFDMVLVTVVAVFKFDIPVRGSFALLPVATAIYLLSVLGIGLFLSTISKTQQQALMAT
ncbi:MAG: ABC transporter permease, partial [Candidatus Dadabacteria bacterium]